MDKKTIEGIKYIAKVCEVLMTEFQAKGFTREEAASFIPPVLAGGFQKANEQRYLILESPPASTHH